MSEETTDFMEMLEGLVPELNMEDISTTDEVVEELSLKLSKTEEKLKTAVSALESLTKLYEGQKNELASIRIQHDASFDSTKANNLSLVKEIVKSLKIDYDVLSKEVINQMGLDNEQLSKRLEAKYAKMTSEVTVVDKIAQKVKAAIEEDLDIDYDDMEIDYGELIEHIDYDNIAYNLCYSTLSDYLSFDPTDYWDASDLAEYFDADDIAEYVNAEEVAEHLDTDAIATEVDLDDIAQRIKAEDVATHIDLDELALFLSQNIDLDDLAQRMRGEEE